MCPNLVGTSGFQHAFHDIHVTQTFQHVIVSHGVFAVVATFRKYTHDFSVRDTPSDVTDNRSVVIFQVSPTYGHVFPTGGFMEKLGRQFGFSFFRFGNDQQAGSVLVYPVNQSRAGIVLFE